MSWLATQARLFALRPLKCLCLHGDTAVRAKENTQPYASEHEALRAH